MTVYIVGGEEECYLRDNAAQVSTVANATWADLDYARAGLRMRQAGVRLNLKVSASNPIVSVGKHYLHFSCNFQSDAQDDANILTMYNTADSSVVRLHKVSTGPAQVIFQARLSAAAGWTSVGGKQAIGAISDIDIYVNASVSGQLRWYVEGELKGEFIGNTDFLKGTNQGIYHWQFQQHNGQSNAISQVIVADESTVGWKLVTLAYESNGSNTDFAGSVSNINEVELRDATGYSASVTGNTQTFNTEEFDARSANASTAAATGTIKAIVATARAKRDSGIAAMGFKNVVRVSTTVFDNGGIYWNTGVSLDTGFQPFQAVWQTDPNTGSTWTKAAVSGLEGGFRLVSAA